MTKADQINISLLCCEEQLLREISDKLFKRIEVAKTYALAIRSEENRLDQINWAKVNRAIIDRWSLSGLRYIKHIAWSGKCFA